ncbi:MAG: phosphopantetheine-binding protein [Chitinivibrionales bacterium]
MSEKLELEIKELIIDSLSLEDLTPEDISSDTPIFGEELGLDSIDALELGVALQKKYGINLQGDSEEKIRSYFSSVKKLAELIKEYQDTGKSPGE